MTKKRKKAVPDLDLGRVRPVAETWPNDSPEKATARLRWMLDRNIEPLEILFAKLPHPSALTGSDEDLPDTWINLNDPSVSPKAELLFLLHVQHLVVQAAAVFEVAERAGDLDTMNQAQAVVGNALQCIECLAEKRPLVSLAMKALLLGRGSTRLGLEPLLLETVPFRRGRVKAGPAAARNRKTKSDAAFERHYAAALQAGVPVGDLAHVTALYWHDEKPNVQFETIQKAVRTRLKKKSSEVR